MGSLELGVKLFASVREAVGEGCVTVSLPEGSRVAELVDRLAEEHPGIASLRAGLAVAVNHELAREDDVLSAGDEVALIPPVGGG